MATDLLLRQIDWSFGCGLPQAQHRELQAYWADRLATFRRKIPIAIAPRVLSPSASI